MVEAGANEVSEAEILDALDIAHAEIKKLCAAAARAAPRRPARRRSTSRRRRSTRACSRRSRAARRRARRGHAGRGQARAPGRDEGRRGGRPRAVLRRPDADDYAEHAPARAARVRQAREGDHPRAHRRQEEAPRRPRARTRSARSRSRSASRRARTARRSSPAARRRRCRVAALGTLKEEMRLDTLGLETQKFYWHHYNFPPFSVGEAGFMRGPKRRDIGHGALAERALVPVVPTHRGLPVHDPRRVGHPRVQRLVVDGVGLRLVAVADGRRRADQARRSRASRWA